MNIKEIIEGIYFVGVNDRTTHRFEALWPIPLGVSYNSYIVKGKTKTALIDGVEISECDKLRDNIESILGAADSTRLPGNKPYGAGSFRIDQGTSQLFP